MRKKVSFAILVNKRYDRSKNLRRGVESTFSYGGVLWEKIGIIAIQNMFGYVPQFYF